MESESAANNRLENRIWSLCRSASCREAALPALLALMLFAGSWKTAPVFGAPDSWYPTLAVMVPLIALALLETVRRFRRRDRFLPGGLIILALFALWLMVRSFSDGTIIPAGVIKATRFAFLPLSLAVVGALLMRTPLTAERFMKTSALIGTFLVAVALLRNQLMPRDHYGLSSFQENSVVFGWTASYALLALLSWTAAARRTSGSVLGGFAVGAVLAAVVLNGARASALALLVAMLLGILVFSSVWNGGPNQLGRARWAGTGLLLGAVLVFGTLALGRAETEVVVANSVVGRTIGVSTSDSIQMRKVEWIGAIGDFMSSPLLGRGTGSFRAGGIMSGREWQVVYPHNVVL